KQEEIALGKEMGAITELFTDPTLRRNTIAALLMAVAGQGALWGIGFWSVDLLLSVLSPYTIALTDIDRTKSVMFLIQQVGAMIGIYLFAVFSERTNRRTAFFVWFGLGVIAIPLFFWGVALAPGVRLPGLLDSVLGVVTFSSGLSDGARAAVQIATLLGFFLGFATLGPFSGYTVYFPELFPTRLRATGCGLCYNGGRFLAALAPLALGALSGYFATIPGALAGGLPMAATVVSAVYILGFIGAWLGPETKGKPLPK
ncbi:MAG TPA: hypothetical protein VKZ59_01315, partial [Acidobacteriota bacterium]|nr:hypothetical protein [Acidobacteriota bacterium]